MLVKEPSFVVVEGRRIAYDDVTPTDPKGSIVLLPGAESNRLTWYKQLHVFGRVFRTIAMDYRDTGDSDPASESYTVADLADDAAGVLTALAIERAHIVGISLGGYVALQMALVHPERVAKLVLVSTSAAYVPAGTQMQQMLTLPQQRTHDMPDEQDEEYRQESQQDNERMQQLLAMVTAPGYFANHPDEWKRMAEWTRYRPMRQEALLHQLQACRSFNVSAQLKELQVHVLVVHGELDPRVDPEYGRFVAQQIKGARLLLYPNTGHLVPIERAEEFNRDVLAFLQE